MPLGFAVALSILPVVFCHTSLGQFPVWGLFLSCVTAGPEQSHSGGLCSTPTDLAGCPPWLLRTWTVLITCAGRETAQTPSRGSLIPSLLKLLLILTQISFCQRLGSSHAQFCQAGEITLLHSPRVSQEPLFCIACYVGSEHSIANERVTLVPCHTMTWTCTSESGPHLSSALKNWPQSCRDTWPQAEIQSPQEASQLTDFTSLRARDSGGHLRTQSLGVTR